MKTKPSLLLSLPMLAALALMAGPPSGETVGPPASAPASTPAPSDPPTRESLDARIKDISTAFYKMQVDPATAVPAEALARAKGVIVIVRTTGAAGLGATSGEGVGFKKGADGMFSSPVFYNVGGASLGLQIGGGETTTVALLMSDNALRALDDSRYLWSGNVRAVLENKSAGASTLDDGTDVVLYQRATGIEIGAAVASTQVAVDDDANRVYYSNPFITPAEVFNLKGRPPIAAEALLMNLNRGAVGWEKAHAQLLAWKNNSTESRATPPVSAAGDLEARPPRAAIEPPAAYPPAG